MIANCTRLVVKEPQRCSAEDTGGIMASVNHGLGRVGGYNGGLTHFSFCGKEKSFCSSGPDAYVTARRFGALLVGARLGLRGTQTCADLEAGVAFGPL